MGQNNNDHGGFGIVGADVPSETLSNVYRTGPAVGRTLARLSEELTGLRDPLRDTKRTVPFTYLPQSLFDPEVTDWRLLEQGRWRFADHITLGEGRACVRLVRILSRYPALFRSKILSLQDNQPIAGAFSKGRSPSPAVNFLARQKSATCLARAFRLILPWVESRLMPADEASRGLERQ